MAEMMRSVSGRVIIAVFPMVDVVFNKDVTNETGALAPAQALSVRAARIRVFYTRVHTDPLRPGVTRSTIKCVIQTYNKSEMSADRRPYRREYEENRRDAVIEAALDPVRLADVSAIRNIDLEVAAP